ncbi:hypothetical protein ABIA85_006671 [Bradyrhizobium sp. LA6.10]|uniref:hypothetical protein n=1 Tax=Bradyrhizobium sp. LA6.10 TaxID=3156318 RepID=UPI00339B638A
MTILSRAEALSAIYKSAAKAMIAIDFPRPTASERISPQPTFVDGPAKNDVGALIGAAETELLATVAERFAALRAAARGTPSIAGEERPDAAPDDWVRPMRIVKDFEISRAHLHRLCALHPISGSAGFALRSGNRFLISLSRFERFAKLHPLRRRETK